MNAHNNAARVAVMAKPCQKQACRPGTGQMPTVQQAMHMACAVVSESLRAAVQAACANGQWRDEYQDVIFSVEAALDAVERLEAEMPTDPDDFDAQWWRATSVARLARDAFPDAKASASLALQTAVRDFEALYRVVDFLAVKAEQEGGAA